MENKLILKGVKVLFVEINEPDFGSSITIDATDESIRQQIEAFNNAQGLKTRFKEYVGKDGKSTMQYSVRLAKFVSVQDEAGNTYDGLDAVEPVAKQIKFTFGSEINLAVKAYEYDNKFGKGKSASVSAIRIVKGAEVKNVMDDLA